MVHDWGDDERRLTDSVSVLVGDANGAYPSGNTLLVRGASESVLIDPSVTVVARGGAPVGVDAVINSHSHEDHMAGNGTFPDARLHIHHDDLPGAQSMEGLMAVYGLTGEARDEFERVILDEFHYAPRPDAQGFGDGHVFDLGGNITVEAVHLPGHTHGHSGFRMNDVFFLSDIDLTGFGPYYGDVWSDLEDFEASLAKVRDEDAEFYVTFHHKGVIEGRETFVADGRCVHLGDRATPRCDARVLARTALDRRDARAPVHLSAARRDGLRRVGRAAQRRTACATHAAPRRSRRSRPRPLSHDLTTPVGPPSPGLAEPTVGPRRPGLGEPTWHDAEMMDAPDFTTLRVAVDGPIGRMTLTQGEKLNPLGTSALREIAQAAQWFDTTEAHVVIVTGEGRGFSSGFDLREFAGGDRDDPSAASSRDQADLGRLMAEAMDRMSALTIAAIKGPCVGGGVVLAGVCDLRIAADDTVFSIPEVDLGIPLAWGGIPRLVREIGPALTRELVLTCRPFSPEEALQIGFINRIVPRAELESAVDELAEQLAKKAPSVVRATKRQVNEALEDVASTAGSWADADQLGAAMRDPDARRRCPRLPRLAHQTLTSRTPPTGYPTTFALQFWWAGPPKLQRKRKKSAEEVGGDVVEEAGGEGERLDVDAFVVAVKP